MEQLFVIYLGGSHEKSLIELHDIRFIIAESIEGTYPIIKKSWWGKPESLHIDAWGILQWVDGYNITIKRCQNFPDPERKLTALGNLPEPEKKLYFLNLGGYDSSQFTELHKNIFIIANNPHEAKLKALAQVAHWELPHKDNQFAVENIINVRGLIEQENHHIELIPSSQEIPFRFTCQYVAIGKKI